MLVITYHIALSYISFRIRNICARLYDRKVFGYYFRKIFIFISKNAVSHALTDKINFRSFFCLVFARSHVTVHKIGHSYET